jgi:cytochrome b pre-mRNA-processing protein 3
MFLFPIRSSARSRAQTARQLYAAATKAARQPFFFREIGVPDTLEGRADMVFLHAGLLVCRLCRLGPDGAKLAQSVFDEMFLNYDWALREMGVGDLAVPRRIKKMMGLFKGQAVAYDESARASLPETKAALLRNVFSVSPPPFPADPFDFGRVCANCVLRFRAAELIRLLSRSCYFWRV